MGRAAVAEKRTTKRRRNAVHSHIGSDTGNPEAATPQIPPSCWTSCSLHNRIRMNRPSPTRLLLLVSVLLLLLRSVSLLARALLSRGCPALSLSVPLSRFSFSLRHPPAFFLDTLPAASSSFPFTLSSACRFPSILDLLPYLVPFLPDPSPAMFLSRTTRMPSSILPSYVVAEAFRRRPRIVPRVPSSCYRQPPPSSLYLALFAQRPTVSPPSLNLAGADPRRGGGGGFTISPPCLALYTVVQVA